ncbi:MAG: hypothetical protein M3301_00030 [Chloroflexota bacterium]|nr:hypothetical protein [Chloroflexota bacterium]
MIVVLGRPALVAGSPEEPEPGRSSRRDHPVPGGLPAWIALAAAAAGKRVELVGSIGDDSDGDALALALGRAGVGHAALLRDPAGTTGRVPAATWPGESDEVDSPPPGPDAERPARPDAERPARLDPDQVPAPAAERSPRFDAEDVDLGLRYLADYRVLVLAEPLPPRAEAVALEAARYQGAAVIAVVPVGTTTSESLRDAGIVLEAPDQGAPAFAELVGRYAAELDSGQVPQRALDAPRNGTGFEQRT